MNKDAVSSEPTNDDDVESFRTELKSKIQTTESIDKQFVDQFIEFYTSIYVNLTKNDENFVSNFANNFNLLRIPITFMVVGGGAAISCEC